jgi:hypothetical protein
MRFPTLLRVLPWMALALGTLGCDPVTRDTVAEMPPSEAIVDALGLPEEGEVTIVAFPDIQWYSLTDQTIGDDRPDGRLAEFLAHFEEPGDGPRILRKMLQWVVDERERQRIVFGSFLGDLVERGADEASRPRWTEARRSIDMLHGELPYGLAVGNHDMVTRTGDTSIFESLFGEERFSGFEWYGGSFGNNVNSFQRVEVEGASLLFLHLACNAPADALDWAGGVIAAHPEARVFISTHMLLGPEAGDHGEAGRAEDQSPVGLMQWTKCYSERGVHARGAWDRLFSRHPQIVAVMSGDQSYYQAAELRMQGEAGNPVLLLMSDYKQLSSEGWLRVLRYHPETGRIRVITYSPILDRVLGSTDVVPDPAIHNFVFAP